jgi:hypothetical protein
MDRWTGRGGMYAALPIRRPIRPAPKRTKRPIPIGTERHTTAWHHPVAASGAPKGYVHCG